MNHRQSFFLFLFSFFFLSSFIFTLSSCRRSTEPVYNPQNLQLKVVDVSCTEAWLSLQAKSDYLNKTLKWFKNDSLLLEKTLTTEDSLLYVDNLWPNTSYRFQVTIYDGPKLMARSATVTATTMDTTSHDFTWQTYEFGGQGGSSTFYDVAIIEENDIWAVGEIYTANDQYNAAHWDGEKWELKKIYYGGWFWTINTVFAFGHDDVWFEAYVRWNGNRFVEYPVPDVLTGYGIKKIWGRSSSDLYVVGNRGLIAHYGGQKWQRIESGTTIDFHDIWGFGDIRLALASLRNYGRGLELIQIKKDKAFILPKNGLHINMRSIWFDQWNYFAVGNGLYWKRYPITSSKMWRNLEDRKLITRYYLYSIRGTSINNIFTAGAFGEVLHFNGLSWKSYYNVTKLAEGVYLSVSVKNNIACFVGNNYSKAVIFLLKK